MNIWILAGPSKWFTFASQCHPICFNSGLGIFYVCSNQPRQLSHAQVIDHEAGKLENADSPHTQHDPPRPRGLELPKYLRPLLRGRAASSVAEVCKLRVIPVRRKQGQRFHAQIIQTTNYDKYFCLSQTLLPRSFPWAFL